MRGTDPKLLILGAQRRPSQEIRNLGSLTQIEARSLSAIAVRGSQCAIWGVENPQHLSGLPTTRPSDRRQSEQEPQGAGIVSESAIRRPSVIGRRASPGSLCRCVPICDLANLTLPKPHHFEPPDS